MTLEEMARSFLRDTEKLERLEDQVHVERAQLESLGVRMADKAHMMGLKRQQALIVDGKVFIAALGGGKKSWCVFDSTSPDRLVDR